MARQTQEPIAIIGIGCRFPGGANSPDAFWKLMCAGTDAITEIPANRWNIRSHYDPNPGRAGKSISKWGGFIENIDQFDPAFFGISPREADWMDPQQRLLLEASWEAIEDGGQILERLRGSATGVFVGISTTDYHSLQTSPVERPAADIYTATGGAVSIAANRVSYSFDLQGPSVAMDTACSSALTALHVACQSIWQGGCKLALAGGVNAILSPTPYLAFSRMSMLSPDGRCKAFDASANGFVRGEGAGMVLVKPLSAAQADGDRIYAVIRATAANQDGGTTGLTVPSAAAQEALVRQACRDAGILPRDVKYIEAHGTGTPVGDPIEAHALGSALGDGRREDAPCAMGSVKTNIGHLESAAGIAGVIKAALVLKHGMIPPSLHFKNPNPHIDFAKLKLRVVQALEPFPNGSGRMLAGINSFGFGGANAHAILEAPPAPAPRARKNGSSRKHVRKAMLLPLSARSPEALRAVAKNYQDLLTRAVALNGSGPELYSICQASALRRTHHSHRLCAVADSREELQEKLAAFLAGETRVGLAVGQAQSSVNGPVFVFSGQGPQWHGMGRELLKTEPLFRDKMQECDRLFRKFGGWSLIDELGRMESDSRLEHTEIAQPAIFALQVALVEIWQSWGVKPAAVVGHSVGEVAAAHVAGVLSLAEAARVIFHRGRCMDQTPPGGRMLAVGLPPEEAKRLLLPYGGQVVIGAFNSPASVTLSGEAEALEEIARSLEKAGTFCRFLHVNYAFHSRRMEPVKEELLAALGSVNRSPAKLPLFSTVTGRLTDGLELDADYWWRNVREPVRFSETIAALIEKGGRIFVELSAHPALLVSVSECLAHRSMTGVVLPSLRRQERERAGMLGSLGALHVAGAPIEWSRLYPEPGTHLDLPAYPWQREKYWREAAMTREIRLENPPHPFLTRNLRTADPSWLTWLDSEAMPYLLQHRASGHAVFPGAASIETVFGVSHAVHGPGPVRLEDVELQRALFLPDNKEVVWFHTSFNPADSTFKLSSRTDRDSEAWTVHVTGKVRGGHPEIQPPPVDLEAIRKRCSSHEVSAATAYAAYESVGFSYGPLYQGLEILWRRDGEALGRIRMPEQILAEAANYNVHPAFLDACFHVHTFSLPVGAGTGSKLLMPVFIERIRFFKTPPRVVYCHAQLVKCGHGFAVWNFQILDEAGETVIDLLGCRSQAPAGMRSTIVNDPEEWLYEQQWKLKPHAGPAHVPDNEPFLSGNAAIAGRARAAAESRNGAGHALSFKKLEGRLNALARIYLADAFRKLANGVRLGKSIPAGKFEQKLGVAPKHRQFFRRCQSILEADGLLRHSQGGWEILSRPQLADPAAEWNKLLDEFPQALPELVLLRRCGLELARILTSEVDAADVVSPDGSVSLLEHLYQDSVSHRDANQLAAEVVAAALENQPQDRVVRILEVGAGTGGLTSFVLPRLRRDRSEYVFADANEKALTKAEQKFFEYAFVRYQKLDLEQPPATQGLKPGVFDLVVISDILRNVASPKAALANIRELLAPDGRLVTMERLRSPLWAEVALGLLENTRAGGDAGPDSNRAQWLKLLAETGFATIENLTPPGVGAGHELFLARVATPAAEKTAQLEPQPKAQPGTWLIFADHGGVGQELARLLIERGGRPLLVFSEPAHRRVSDDCFEMPASSGADMGKLLAEAGSAGRGPLAGVVHLWSLDFTAADGMDIECLRRAEVETCHSTLQLVQALSADDAPASMPLWLVTRGAQPVHPQEAMACAAAPLIGLGRSINTECRHIRCRLVDLTPGGASTDAASLLQEIDANDSETEIAFRAAARHVNRLMRTNLAKHVPPSRTGHRFGYRVEIPHPGIMDQIAFREIRRRQPGAGEVEIEICAAALNFRDVMKALGIYPSESDHDFLVGDECSGRIAAVGKGVKNCRVGDEVIASGLGCFASHITVPAAVVIPKPARISFEEAVTVPVAFMTAWYALHQLGRIRSGEKILIQAATGGVGLAAIQIARLAGAEIFATAGNPEKRDFLRAMGVRHVMDSRSVAFADEIREITGGKGVDLVLNSLAGPAIAKGLSCLGQHGRFLEIGKRDIYQNTAVGLRPFRNNLSMFVIDMGQVMQQQPDRIRELLEPVLKFVQQGKLHPLPLRALPVSRVVSAFRLMAQAKHVGKIVVSMAGERITPERLPEKKPIRFRADAAYLITGGLGGFGLAVARWMVASGARHLVLTGRSGAVTAEARKAVKDLKHLGADVSVVKADVTKRADVDRIFKLISRRSQPLRGVMHAPMVLDDGMLSQLTPDRFSSVLGPKVTGAWNLHLASAGLPLDFFVLFSSISSVVGAAGQANYAAANAFLDSLAHHRRAFGLSALAVNWGPLSEVGVLTRNARAAEHLAAHGLVGLATEQATEMLGRLLQSDAAQLAFMRVDWQKFMPTGGGEAPRRFEALMQNTGGAQAGGGEKLGKTILAAPASERLGLVTMHLRELVARVLRTSASKLELERPLKEMGLDSLMAFEMLNHIEIQFGITLPPSKFNSGSNIATVSAVVLEILSGAATNSGKTQPAIAEATPVVIPTAAPAEAPSEWVFALREGGSRPPLFCLHPAGGLVHIYQDLATLVPEGVPVYGIHSRPDADPAGEPDSVAAMAWDYAGLILERQPKGPFQLAGFSLGGLLALATARELERRGGEIGFVGLIDTPLALLDPAYPRSRYLQRQIVEMNEYFQTEMFALKPVEPGRLLEAAGRLAEQMQAAPVRDHAKINLEWLIGEKLIRPDDPTALVERFIATACAHWDAATKVVLEPVAARVHHWKAGLLREKGAESAPKGSRITTGEFTEEILDGRHFALMQPPLVEILAAGLETLLPEAGAARPAVELEFAAK